MFIWMIYFVFPPFTVLSQGWPVRQYTAMVGLGPLCMQAWCWMGAAFNFCFFFPCSWSMEIFLHFVSGAMRVDVLWFKLRWTLCAVSSSLYKSGTLPSGPCPRGVHAGVLCNHPPLTLKRRHRHTPVLWLWSSGQRRTRPSSPWVCSIPPVSASPISLRQHAQTERARASLFLTVFIVRPAFCFYHVSFLNTYLVHLWKMAETGQKKNLATGQYWAVVSVQQCCAIGTCSARQCPQYCPWCTTEARFVRQCMGRYRNISQGVGGDCHCCCCSVILLRPNMESKVPRGRPHVCSTSAIPSLFYCVPFYFFRIKRAREYKKLHFSILALLQVRLLNCCLLWQNENVP